MTFKLCNLKAPTPKRMVKLGNALVAISLTGIPVIAEGKPWIGWSMLAIGVVGKFLTNFFAADEPSEPAKNEAEG